MVFFYVQSQFTHNCRKSIVASSQTNASSRSWFGFSPHFDFVQAGEAND